MRSRRCNPWVVDGEELITLPVPLHARPKLLQCRQRVLSRSLDQSTCPASDFARLYRARARLRRVRLAERFQFHPTAA
jgi:hypothetical protein